MRTASTLLIAALTALMLAGPAIADATDEAKHVIERQIRAFLEDDAETAYSFAAPGIRRMYPDTESFFAMVRRGYAPVYRPDNFAFGRSRVLPDGFVVQEVLIAGPDGKDWTAIYVLESVEGELKIRGVRMRKSAAPEI